MSDHYIDIPDGKKREFFSGMFGVNRLMGKREKLPVDQTTVYDAFGLYFNWAKGISDERERDQKIIEGEFALQDLQTDGYMEVSEGTDAYDYYSGLDIRKRRIDTLEVRRKVFGQITSLVVEIREIAQDNPTGQIPTESR